MTRANDVNQRVILLATDSSQSIIGESVEGKVNTIGYSAYGEQSAQQEVASALGFNGQLREARLGWYLLGNGYRAYNTRLMRLHSPDSWSPFGGGGLNAYMYCVGDPVNRVDPTGHMTFLKFLSKSFDFFFGGADVTGPRRLTSAQASTIERLGGLRPEKTGEGNGLANVAKAVIAGAPVKRSSGLHPGGNLAPQGVRWGVDAPFVNHRQPARSAGSGPNLSRPAASAQQPSTLRPENMNRASIWSVKTLYQGPPAPQLRFDTVRPLGGEAPLPPNYWKGRPPQDQPPTHQPQNPAPQMLGNAIPPQEARDRHAAAVALLRLGR